MVSVLHWGVISQIHHMIENWWWEMITNRLKSLHNLYLKTKNQNISTYEDHLYTVTLPYNILPYFVFCLILRGDNAVLMLLITKKTYIEQLWRLTYMLKIIWRNDSYVTTLLWNTSNLGESVLYFVNNKIENVWRLYFCNRSIHGC